MASRRMIASDIFEDDFVGFLNFFGRLVWIGMIVVCADDQGRLFDNSPLIRAKTFPFDKSITDDKVDEVLAKAAKEGKIVRYEAAGKLLLQVVRWWDYQQPAWASGSKYPAPEGWMDRVRCHVKGNYTYKLNWEEPGGFIEGYQGDVNNNQRSGLRSALRSGIDEGEGENEFKGESTSSSAAAAKVPKNPMEASNNPDILLYKKITDMFPGEDRYKTIVENIELIRVLHEFPNEGAMEQYLAPFWLAWKAGKRQDGESFDPFSLAWLVEWSVGGRIPARNKKPRLAGNGNGNGYHLAEAKENTIDKLRKMKDGNVQHI
jgi:hypothetical protein